MRALSSSALETPASGIREIVNAVIGREDVMRLEIGQPSFAPPQHILDAVAAAGPSSGGYTASAGIRSLREAIVEKVDRVNSITTSPDDVTVTVGAMGGVFLTLMALCEPGDAILVPDVAWPNYLMAARSLGIRCLLYSAGPSVGYVPDLGSIDTLAPEAKVLFINTPSNPAGAVIPRDLTVDLLDLAARHDLWVVSDETYDQLTFDAEHVSPMSVDPDARVVGVFSFSKTYAIPGWRIGYVVAPAPVSAVIQKLMEPTVSCAPSIAQIAADAALRGPQDVVTQMRDAYRSRRDTAIAILMDHGLAQYTPQGAFYMMVDIGSSGKDSRRFALDLLDARGVAVAPGRAFGEAAEGYVRICFAADEATVATGVARLAEFLVQVS